MESLTPATLGLPAFLILFGFTTFFAGLLRGDWYLKREYKALEVSLEKMTGERDYWRDRVERGASLAEQATSIANRVLPPAGSTG